MFVFVDVNRPSTLLDIVECLSSAREGSAADNLIPRHVLKCCHPCQTVVETMVSSCEFECSIKK